MLKALILVGGLAVLALGCAATPARADFSACASAYEAKDLHQQIDLYTTCLKHGGLPGDALAGAFNNRGVAYEQLGETDKALQDFISATQYDPNWPEFRRNRADTEAQLG
ncbi:MAG TPA: tetratricopeptide repeat protein [Caulobacteraceae bacterium]